jgi:hypothetical protein
MAPISSPYEPRLYARVQNGQLCREFASGEMCDILHMAIASIVSFEALGERGMPFG